MNSALANKQEIANEENHDVNRRRRAGRVRDRLQRRIRYGYDHHGYDGCVDHAFHFGYDHRSGHHWQHGFDRG